MSMRQGVCPECGHRQIIETAVAEFGYQDREKPMCVTYDARWVMSGRNPDYGYGRLKLYTCRACGLSQWYASDPATIPIGSDYHTRVIEG